jgi:LacI family transcriptional regulator
VPHHVAVAGFDDIATLRDITPGLTTVALPLEDMGASALDLVLAEWSSTPRRGKVEGRLIVRESTPGL